MKVAMIITSLEVGGAEKAVLDLLERIRDKVQVRLYVMKKNYHSIYDKKAETLGVPVFYLKNRLRFMNIVTAINLKKMLDEFRPDIIHTHLKSSSFIYYYRLSSKSFHWIHTVHTRGKTDTKFFRRLFFRKIYRNGIIKAVAVSNKVQDSLIHLYKNIDSTVIYNGIDINNMSKNHHGNFTVCHVGRFVKAKNHRYLIKEFSMFLKIAPDARLLLIGEGKLKQKMIRLAKTLNIDKSISFIGQTNEVAKYLNCSDVFVLPSLYEGMPLSLLEAMSFGMISIAGSCCDEVIDNGWNGYIINLKEGELCEKLKEIYITLDSFDFIRKNALKKVLQFSKESMVESYLKLYREVLYG